MARFWKEEIIIRSLTLIFSSTHLKGNKGTMLIKQFSEYLNFRTDLTKIHVIFYKKWYFLELQVLYFNKESSSEILLGSTILPPSNHFFRKQVVGEFFSYQESFAYDELAIPPAKSAHPVGMYWLNQIIYF